MVCSMWACRETPYWLVENQREEEARRSLQWYRGGQYDIKEEIEEMILNKREKEGEDKTERSLCSLLSTLSSTTFLRPFSCAGLLYILAQWTGISTMVFFMTTIFQQSGSSLDPHLCPVIVAGTRVLTAGLAFFVLRYANRRYLFVFSSAIITLSTSTIATFAYVNTSDCCLDSDTKDRIGMVPLLAVISMFVGHALGVVPVCQLTAAEVFPTEIRTLGSGICVAVATVANALNSKVGRDKHYLVVIFLIQDISRVTRLARLPRNILVVQRGGSLNDDHWCSCHP